MRHKMAVPGRFRATILGLALATLLPALAAGDTVSNTHEVVCTSDLSHPVDVRVTALDPIRRGATVRFVVSSTSRIGLGRAEARLVHAGGASVAGPARLALGRLEPQRAKQATFRVVLPQGGARTLLQFKVVGEGPNGTLARGAVYNVLPDGPSEKLRATTTSTGEKVLDAPARRIDR
jgi:hypothetical protein